LYNSFILVLLQLRGPLYKRPKSSSLYSSISQSPVTFKLILTIPYLRYCLSRDMWHLRWEFGPQRTAA